MDFKTDSKNLPVIILFFVNFTWGIDFLAIEYMAKYIPAGTMSFARLGIGFVLMTAYAFFVNKGLKISIKDWPRVFFCGAVGLSLYYTIEPIGIHMTSGSVGALIMATVPIYGMIADRIIYNKKITLIKVISILFSILGVFLLIIGGGGDDLKGNVTGIGVMLIAAFMWTSFIVAVKPLHEKYKTTTILTGMFMSGFAVSSIVMFMDGGFRGEWTWPVISITVGTAIVGVILCEIGYIYSVGKLSVTLVALFENVLPLVTVICSLIVFGQSLAPVQLIGGLIILASVTVVTIKEEK